MGQKITLSSNIPINLPEKLSDNVFGLGFLYPCHSGKGFQLKEGQTWFEKVCLSLNKFNALVGFQNSNLKIPEYIAETISMIEKQIEDTTLLVRYNAQTKINDLIGTLAPEKTKVSFDDKSARSLTKGTPMVILGERSLKKMFAQFESVFGLENKIKFVLNHEIAHNIDCSQKYARGEYSLKDIMESHVGSRITANGNSPFESNAELIQAKKMIRQIWTLSLEHYADTRGFLNMRNQLLEEGVSAKEITPMLDGLIYERKKNYKENVTDFFDRKNNPEKGILDFEDRYKCMNHLTINALSEIKERVQDLGDKKLTNREIECLTVEIVTKSDLKALYILDKIDNTTAKLLEKIFHSKVNENSFIYGSESRKPKFEENIKKLLGEDWIKETDKFILQNKDKNGLYDNISKLFTYSTDELKEVNKKELNDKIQKVRNSSINYEIKIEKKLN